MGARMQIQFRSNGGAFIDGMGITWIDTLGNSDSKWSYLNQALDINHEAHVEAPEPGTHRIVITEQAGCSPGRCDLRIGKQMPNTDPQEVDVKITSGMKNATIFVDVDCN